jgi:Membrane domain of glycerophosphoryl diester phosphodiesterase
MREFSVPNPAEQKPLSTGRILKESWEICTQYFGALVMPMFLLMIPGMIIAAAIDGKPGEAIGNFIGGLLMPIASMGACRMVIMLKRSGDKPTLSTTFNEGFKHWWAGIRIGIVSGLYIIGLVMGILILVLPGALLMDGNTIAGGALLTLGIGVSLWLTFWFAARACLATPSMADGSTSSFRAFDAGWKIAKNNAKQTTKILLSIIGIAILAFIVSMVMLIVLIAIVSAADLDPEGPLVAIMVLPFVIPYAALLTYAYIAFSLTYLALKPAPKDENPARTN